MPNSLLLLRPARFDVWTLLRATAVLAGFALTPWWATATIAQQDTTHLKVSARAYGATQDLSVQINKSVVVDLPANVAEVIVSQPAVAAVIMRTKTRAIVQGIAAGDTNVFFMDAKGGTISLLDIKVFQQRSEIGIVLESALARIIPGSHIRVESLSSSSVNGESNRVVLSGTAQSQDDMQQAIAIAGQFAGAAENVTSVMTVTGSQQVKLKVTIAEVSRETVKQLGINLDGSISFGAITAGLTSIPAVGGASGVAASNGVSVGIDTGAFSLTASLKALERRGAMRTLAEPTLTAISGQEAEFLAGGQFPVPTGVADGVVTFTFKDFGVNLKFTPTVKSNGIIALAVDTSVSEPTTEGGFSAGGVTIPATKERKAKTSVELPSGQTLAIAGLIEDKVRQQFNAIPGIGDIPILGALFRSRDFIHSQTELMILVTPYLAYAGGTPTLPTDGYAVAGDAEAIFLGHMEKMYGVGGGNPGGYSGSVGFVLD